MQIQFSIILLLLLFLLLFIETDVTLSDRSSVRYSSVPVSDLLYFK